MHKKPKTSYMYKVVKLAKYILDIIKSLIDLFF